MEGEGSKIKGRKRENIMVRSREGEGYERTERRA